MNKVNLIDEYYFYVSGNDNDNKNIVILSGSIAYILESEIFPTFLFRVMYTFLFNLYFNFAFHLE